MFSGDIIIYLFVIISAMVVSEDYMTGAIKNVVGLGISKANYYASMVLVPTILAVGILFLQAIIRAIALTIKFGLGDFTQIPYNIIAVAIKVLDIINTMSM